MGFSAIAPLYSFLEKCAFGRRLEETRFAGLDFLTEKLPQDTRVLVVGDGDGRFTLELVSRRPDLRIDFVELSEGMLTLAKSKFQKLSSPPHIRWVHQDIREWKATEYSLIVTHFFLDCFSPDELPSLVEDLKNKIVLGGYWLHSDFSPSTGTWARALLKTMYLFFRLTAGLKTRQLLKPQPLFRGYSLELIFQFSQAKGFIYSEIWRKNL